MAVYDTEKARRAARLIRSSAAELRENTGSDLKKSIRDAEPLQGKTADRLEEVLEEMERSANSISSELESLSKKVDLYADLMEEADAKIANAMKH